MGRSVSLRVLTAIGDLHAVGAMYHRHCPQTFKSNVGKSQFEVGSSNDVS